jgi:hypothetical protein
MGGSEEKSAFDTANCKRGRIKRKNEGSILGSAGGGTGGFDVGAVAFGGDGAALGGAGG